MAQRAPDRPRVSGEAGAAHPALAEVVSRTRGRTQCVPLLGPGQEFLDHRHFHHGDDLRAVNWRAYLRLEKLLLKMFQVEPRIPVRLLIDTSESMGTGDSAKFEYAQKLAAALTYVDSFVLTPYACRHLLIRSAGPVTAGAAAIALFLRSISSTI